MKIEIVYAAEFFRAARNLKKRYPHVVDDAETFADQLEAGETPGDRIRELERIVYKARIKNSDARKGKSGGYRIVYYLKTAEKIVIITIYSKSDQKDIPIPLLRRFIEEYEASLGKET